MIYRITLTLFYVGFRTVARLVRTQAFQDIGATMHLPKTPDCVPDGVKGDAKDAHALYQEYVGCIIRLGAFTGYHPIGTARIGAKDDPKAVVDPHLK